MGPVGGHAQIGYRLNPLLIHADPGARSGFVSAWLQDQLAKAEFDVGASVSSRFTKIHTPNSINQIKNFSGTRIRIRPSFDKLNLQLLLFLRKNVYVQLPNFTKNEFSLETCSKLYIFAQERFEHDSTLDYSLYNHVLFFQDTFDLDKLIQLYNTVNHNKPSQIHIDHAVKNNSLNQILVDPNHACNIASMILQAESTLKLQEKNRLWSLPEVYKHTRTTDLYDTIKTLITPKNYQTGV
jgi:hypothetical protein